MANTAFPMNHPLAVKLWSKKLFHEALFQTYANKFIGDSSDAMIQRKTETQKGAGDRVTFGLRVQLDGAGVAGDGTLEGNEEALVTYADNIYVDQLRHAVRSDGQMSEQRVPFSVREECRLGLQDWWADRIDTALFNQLAGNTLALDTRYTGSNGTTAPSADNQIFGGGQGSEASVAGDASAIFTLRLIDIAVEKAKTLKPMIRPIRINGNNKYVLFLHPYQVTQLRTNTSAGQWLDIQKAAMSGGQISNNPIYTGALGEYNNCILHETIRLPNGIVGGVAAPEVRRAVFCGAQAGVIAYGQKNADNKMSWVEEKFDYGNKLGVAAGLIWGTKKTVFDNRDFSTIVISTNSQAHIA